LHREKPLSRALELELASALRFLLREVLALDGEEPLALRLLLRRELLLLLCELRFLLFKELPHVAGGQRRWLCYRRWAKKKSVGQVLVLMMMFFDV